VREVAEVLETLVVDFQVADLVVVVEVIGNGIFHFLSPNINYTRFALTHKFKTIPNYKKVVYCNKSIL
jgi:hypothetical protein